MIVVGMLTSLHVVGVNIQPLLAFGGVSGIAIGLGAQQVTANLVAGVNLVIASHNTYPLHCNLRERVPFVGLAKLSLRKKQWHWVEGTGVCPNTSIPGGLGLGLGFRVDPTLTLGSTTPKLSS